MFLTVIYIKTPDSTKEKPAYDEQVSFVRKLKNSDLQKSTAILDLTNEKLIKNRSGEDYNTLYSYFYSHYKKAFDAINSPITLS